jgi:hypothetical protein
MYGLTHYRRYRATEERRGAARTNFAINVRQSDKVTAVEFTRHIRLVLLLKLMLKARQRVGKLRKERDRKRTVGNLQQGKLRNCIFGGQQYDRILIKL